MCKGKLIETKADLYKKNKGIMQREGYRHAYKETEKWGKNKVEKKKGGVLLHE
jgi:hypothetical protein